MQEWLNWHAWKVCRLFAGSPGFESPSFRHFMTIHILTIGKHHESWTKEGIEVFLKRLRPPFSVDFVIMPHYANGKSFPTPPSSAIWTQMQYPDGKISTHNGMGANIYGKCPQRIRINIEPGSKKGFLEIRL